MIALGRSEKGKTPSAFPFEYGAAEESRTLDLNLGKVALYQLSYCRKLQGLRPACLPAFHFATSVTRPTNLVQAANFIGFNA